jgi:hypothetical protein
MAIEISSPFSSSGASRNSEPSMDKRPPEMKNIVHKLLSQKLLSQACKGGLIKYRQQALLCPFYVRLRGSLGHNWGVITNPVSRKFGEVVFEHDGCGCPNHQQVSDTTAE